jgi:hypothetical protein
LKRGDTGGFALGRFGKILPPPEGVKKSHIHPHPVPPPSRGRKFIINFNKLKLATEGTEITEFLKPKKYKDKCQVSKAIRLRRTKVEKRNFLYNQVYPLPHGEMAG